jgi:S-adenosylmethionine-diacylglycerol 3-amino-3-carboxypropyl transferase
MAILDWFSGRVFKFVHGNNLVYNTCWEDPRLDRVALELQSHDNVLVITSAGCNALDYALCSPNHVYAVDMNPRQNALLELKQQAIRHLEYEDFFKMFGVGRLPNARAIYNDKLRSGLSDWSQAYWDKCIRFFENKHNTFYFHGTSGAFAKWVSYYIDSVIKVRPQINALLAATSVEEQKEIYEKELKKKFWTWMIRFFMKRDATLSMLGVPKAQRRQIDLQYPGGIMQFIEDCVETVFAKLPMSDNYFWRVYLTGSYTEKCCPEYVKAENFQKLKSGLVDKVTTHTNSVQAFLEQHNGQISRYILLDHMDWLADKLFPILELEWQAILDKAAPNTRILWRSGGLRTDFVDKVQVQHNGKLTHVHELLKFHDETSTRLHKLDRVHTYGSFYIADLLPTVANRTAAPHGSPAHVVS